MSLKHILKDKKILQIYEVKLKHILKDKKKLQIYVVKPAKAS